MVLLSYDLGGGFKRLYSLGLDDRAGSHAFGTLRSLEVHLWLQGIKGARPPSGAKVPNGDPGGYWAGTCAA